ncbi:MAG: ABC transporter permease subunit [Candidatus Latescibacterota bacterium]
MIADILTMLWKEWLEYMHMRGSGKGTFFSMVIPLLILGIFLPLQFGRAWIESPASLVAWAWLPLLLTTMVIADSIAGERERHTLETLLASRLSDRAILFGKLLASMLYALALTLLIILAGLVTVNIAQGDEGFIFFTAPMLLAGFFSSILGTAFMSSIGILVSLRAATVRQAQQTLSFGVIIIAVLPTLLINVLPPDLRADIIVALESMNATSAAIGALGFFLLVDVFLIAWSIRRFKRTRLMEG